MGILWFPAMRNHRRVGLGRACEVHGVEAITEREREKERQTEGQKCVPVWVMLSNAQVYIYRHVRSVHSLPVYNCGRCLFVFVIGFNCLCGFKLSINPAVSLLVG